MAQSFRILIVLTPALDPTSGGVQMSTVKMARMLRSAGHHIGVYSFTRSGHAEIEKVNLFSVPEDGGVSTPANLQDFERCLVEFKPDFIINQMPYELQLGDRIRSFGKAMSLGCLRNTLYSVRNNLEQYMKSSVPRHVFPLVNNALGRAVLLAHHRRRHARDLRRILATYDRFVMFAEPNLEELAYFVPDHDPDVVALIPNSIPATAPVVPVKQKRILWLARVSVHQKRADLVLPMWRRIAPVLPDWSLDIVGDGPFLDQMRQQVAAEQLPRVVFHGRQPSMPFFERSAIFLMTSDFEGFPNTLIEAQSQGAVPVALNSYPMVEWLIENGKNGVLAPRGDVGALVDAVIELARSAELRGALAEGALASAARFTEANVSLKWLALIEELS